MSVPLSSVPLHIILVEPEIPPNTGSIARLCVASGAALHLIEPLGFSIDERAVQRAGMDYWKHCRVQTWPSLEACQAGCGASRYLYLTTKSTRPYWDWRFQPGDALVFGRESRGLPESLLAANADHCLTIPMNPDARSINLAVSTGIVLYEAIRQLALD